MYARFSLRSGKAPYRSVHTGPAANRYADRPLPGAVVARAPLPPAGRPRDVAARGSLARRSLPWVAHGQLLSPCGETKRLPALGE
ncbi:hypothetical protein GW17_00006963 [Ensete ventricosum]|nr:hypothetical protein GW17_00006963 [Ensete ventricosum]RZR87313.1 hypothetical protein BHM03_00014686 [Ensete ventricosum]